MAATVHTSEALTASTCPKRKDDRSVVQLSLVETRTMPSPKAKAKKTPMTVSSLSRRFWETKAMSTAVVMPAAAPPRRRLPSKA
jgi:hypothetical protein